MKRAWPIVLFLLLLTTPARAGGSVIYWEGQGAEELPCAFGGHWVLDLLDAGWSRRRIATELGLSTQRISQHVEKLQLKGYLPLNHEVAS